MRVLIALTIIICFCVGGCASSKRAQLAEVKHCPERICAGDIWPADYTNCTCR